MNHVKRRATHRFHRDAGHQKRKDAAEENAQSKEIFKDFELTKKISYIKAIPFLDWVIGTGLYTDNLDTHLNEKKALLEVKLQNDVRTIIIFSSLVTFIIIIFLIFLSKKLKNIFHFYSKNLEDSNLKLKKLNEKLEEKVQKQVNAIRQKDVLINQQSKLVAMGEMIGNIAHQWRQPLSAISSIASGIIIKKEIGKIEENNFQEDLEAIISTTKVLSTTIDDFRNFYSKEKIISHFKIENTIEKVLSLISTNIKNSDINLIKNIEELEITSYENELIQVILNIINNAKDALCENIQTTKYIFIKVKQNKNELTINIYDNGGGISENIINRIFEPYFTTKFKAQGTGIGLYMTKNIIEKNLKGRIKVKNKKFVYNKKEYKGALFKIELPLNLNP